MADNTVLGSNLENSDGVALTEVEIVTINNSPTTSLEATDTGIRIATVQTNSEVGQTYTTNDNELATVTATPQGDIVNGVQTNVNPTPDITGEAILNTSTIEDYSFANKGLAASSIGTPQVQIPNPLHSYASYTYGLSLHLMTPNDFNAVMSSRNPIYIPTNVLVASAGKYNTSNFIRNPAFNEDFYFEDLKIATIIGITPLSRATNAIDINFTLIEPNGFTFINRLLEAATLVDSKNYLDIPYMLQIDFYGSTDDGTAMAPIPGQTKHIPIMLTGVKSKIGARGAEYRITAVPYGHKGFRESVASTPTNFQVQAATVRDFFGSGISSVDAYNTAYGNNQRIEQINKELAGATDDATKQSLQLQLGQLGDLNQVYTVKEGYANAVNGWYQYLQYKRKRSTVDTISIVVDPEIGSALVTVPEQNDTRRMANATKAEQNAARASAIGATVGGPKFTEGYYPINAGTPIDKVIESVIRTSTYITKQITDPNVDNPESIAQKLGRPLKWFKIVPKVTLGDYDYATGQYAKHYTYYVKKWTVSNKVPIAPMGKASGFVKKYDYIYTGKNSDVIDVSLDFDTLYYIQMTANKTENQETVGLKRPDYLVTDYSIPEIYPTNTVMPKRYVHFPQDIQYSGQFNGARGAKILSTGDLTRNLTGTARGDMLQVKLTILGDPTFIKQDDVFHNLTEFNSGQLLTPNGSLVMDDGELYVLLIFKSPTDYDEITGLYRNDRYSYSMFSGVYRITTVENQFSKGKFTQVLNLARLQNQPQFDDLLGGQYSQVLQFQRIDQQILNAALTPLQSISRNAAGRLLGGLGSVLAVASAAAQIAQNAQAIATGMLSTVVNNVVGRFTAAAENWARENILTPLETWFDGIKGQIGQWFDDTLFKAEIFFSGNWDAYNSEFLTCTADSFSTDLTTIAAGLSSGVALDFSLMSQEGINELITSMGLETFDIVDDSVFDALDW